MADDSQVPNDSPSTDVGSSAPGSSGQGFSIVKVLGIAVGLIGIAAAVIGFTFWKTLRDSSTKEAVVLDGYGDPDDYEYPEEIAAKEEAAAIRALAAEDAAAEEAAEDAGADSSEEGDPEGEETSTDADSEKSDEPASE